MKKYGKIFSFLLILVCIGSRAESIQAAAPSLSSASVKLGQTITVKNAGKDAVYQSADPSTAYVNQAGIITGKKVGQTTVTVKQKGQKHQTKLTVTVKANKKLPTIPVCYDETSLGNETLTADEENGSLSYSAVVKNNSQKGTAKKIQYTFEIQKVKKIKTEDDSKEGNEDKEDTDQKEQTDKETGGQTTGDSNSQKAPETKDQITGDSDSQKNPEADNQTDTQKPSDAEGSESDPVTPPPAQTPAPDNPGGATDPGDTENPSEKPGEDSEKEVIVTKKVTVTVKKLLPGKKEKISIKGIVPGSQPKLLQIQIYSGDALITWNAAKKTSKLSWGTKDTKAPVISGFVGKNSYNLDDVCMVVYPDRKYSFQKYVKASDDRDEQVSLKTDTSKINWKKKGTYKITYTATDSAGNRSKATAQVQVRTGDRLDQMADQILSRIVKESWSDTKKIKAIYNYIKRNYSYVDSNDHASWERSAERGLRYKYGNCFTYYSISRLLLTRCGIPNLTIRRSQGHGNHWWNLVYVQGGWYHFDATPRSVRAVLCLLTDQQLETYSRSAYNSHIYNKKLYPKRATKILTPLIRGRNTF